MILNSFAILDGFVTFLRFGLALVIVFLAVPVWRVWGRSDLKGKSDLKGQSDSRGQSDPKGREHLENRTYLLCLLAFLLLFLNLVSWPLLYLLLQSYVPEWPGVMCVYGVTRIGIGSQGISRFLPDLLLSLQVLKPILVFFGGVWICLYLANRPTSNSPLMGRILLTLIGLGILGVLDSSAEAAYLIIPKKEDIPEVGCCTASIDEEVRFLPASLLGDKAQTWLTPAFYGLNGCMVLGLFGFMQILPREKAGVKANRPGSQMSGGLALLFLGSMVCLMASGLFLIDVAAPTWLHLPNHHCPYDLIPRVPEATLGVASFIAGTFSVGWGFFVAIFAKCSETNGTLPGLVRRILTLGIFGYAGAMVMVAVEFRLV